MGYLFFNETLKDTFSSFDYITVTGKNQEEHDWNVKKFLTVIKAKNLTLNETKIVFSLPALNILGYWIGNGIIKPEPLQELPMLITLILSRRAVGMFVYYAKWVPRFFDKILLLIRNNNFPLNATAFKTQKKSQENATLLNIDEELSFVVECDASDVSVSATHNQRSRPVAFMALTLQGSELHYPFIEKEVTAIIEKTMVPLTHLLEHFVLH